MSETLLALLAFSPIVVAAILLVGLNWPAKKAMPVAFALTVAIALFAWDMSGALACWLPYSKASGLPCRFSDCVWRHLLIKHFETHRSYHHHPQRIY